MRRRDSGQAKERVSAQRSGREGFQERERERDKMRNLFEKGNEGKGDRGRSERERKRGENTVSLTR